MAEYIEREAAVEIAEKYGLTNGVVLGVHSGLADCIASEINAIPAANVEPVVRCKDCKKSNLTEFGKRYCSEPMGAFYGCIPVEDSFFCSGGKRLEENEQ